MDIVEKINDLCVCTTNPAVLNALHACRPDHPLGRGNDWKWRNAYSLVSQQTIDFLGADIFWLESRAVAEGNAGR